MAIPHGKEPRISIDHLDAELYSPIGPSPLVVIDLAEADAEERARDLSQITHAIVVGIDRQGDLPAVDAAPFDCLLTTIETPPRPWVGIAASRIEGRLAAIEAIVANAPIAAGTCLRVLRITEHLSMQDALFVESLAYSALLGGEEFRAWRAAHPVRPPAYDDDDLPWLRVDRDDDHVTVTLSRPHDRNATRAGMRDALFEALANLLDDPSLPRLTLCGEGDSFSTGGALDEFGSAADLAAAHVVRYLRSCAGRLAALGDRAEVILHGACVGAGIEIGAAAAHRRATADAFFQLPEIAMGLMPGAGGTATLPRAIGRHRAATMMLDGKRISAQVALDWGLVHRIEPS